MKIGIDIESEEFNCFSTNLLVVQNFTSQTRRKRGEAADIPLASAHWYATHYLSQNSCIANQRTAFLIERQYIHTKTR